MYIFNLDLSPPLQAEISSCLLTTRLGYLKVNVSKTELLMFHVKNKPQNCFLQLFPTPEQKNPFPGNTAFILVANPSGSTFKTYTKSNLFPLS